MISVIAFLFVSGCVCAPSGNTISTISSSSSSSSQVSSSVSGSSPDGVVYTITQKFSSGVPNITSTIGNVTLSKTSPLFGTSIFSAHKNAAAAIRNQTNQAFAAIHKQHLAHLSRINSISNSIHQSVKANHAAFQNSMKNMFRPLSLFSSSSFFV